jgi:hypothetical protein
LDPDVWESGRLDVHDLIDAFAPDADDLFIEILGLGPAPYFDPPHPVEVPESFHGSPDDYVFIENLARCLADGATGGAEHFRKILFATADESPCTPDELDWIARRVAELKGW